MSRLKLLGCTERDAELIESENNLHFTVADYWIGMTDETVENVWKWYGTDSIVEYFDWGPTEPQNANNEDCAVFGDTIDYTWADVKCASNRKALCEMPYVSSKQQTLPC